MTNAHILVVDDSEMTIYKLKAILIRLGYRVTTFTNSVMALDWLKTTRQAADLILSDVTMPEMNGVEFVKEIRQLGDYARTPVIMLSIQTDIEDKIASLQAGADDYMVKTVSATELDLRVKALLSRAEESKTTFSQSMVKVITVFSLRGGVGTTSISVNLSVAVSQMLGIDTCLWDMSLSGGHCATLLNLKPKITPADIHTWPEGHVDETVLDKLLIEHESGLKLMPAPLSAAEAELVTPRTADMILPFLLGNFAFLVVDAGNHFTDPVLNILERSDVILLVLSPEIASLRSASNALQIFAEMGFDLKKVVLLVNNTFLKYRLPLKKIRLILDKLPLIEIPYDSERMMRAMMSGEPVITTDPKSEISLAFISLANQLNVQQMETKKNGLSAQMQSTIQNLFPGMGRV